MKSEYRFHFGKEGDMGHLNLNISESIRLKQETFLLLQRLKEGVFNPLSEKKALNPFCNDVRHFQTVFNILDSEAMMDFGIWIMKRYEGERGVHPYVERLLELLYELMYRETKCKELLTIIVEEDFEVLYISMFFEKPIMAHHELDELQYLLHPNYVALEKSLHIRLKMHEDENKKHFERSEAIVSVPIIPAKAMHTIPSEEKELLRRSFIDKNSAREYVQDLGGDVLEEIHDLSSADDEWKQYLNIMENEPNADNLHKFVDGVLGIYAGAINNLFEFTALGYSLSSLGVFLKTNAPEIMSNPLKRGRLMMFLENLRDDLASWRSHIFILQDTGDIHYLDSSFFSSCMQIEEMMSDQEIAVDDENDMEFF
jgi:hypothetical protein